MKLPAETRAYVPKLLAMKRLMAEPERYGLEFAPIPNEPYFAVIDTGSQIDLKIAAKLAATSYDELVALNPGYNRWATDPDGPHRLLVPIDAADGFEASLKTLAPEDRMRYVAHTVGRRETLPAIAKQYGTTVAVIAKLNDIKGRKLKVGESLQIPENSGQLPDKVLLAALRVDQPATDRGGRRQRQIVHRVRAGETLEHHRTPSRHGGRDARPPEQHGPGRQPGQGSAAGDQGQFAPLSRRRGDVGAAYPVYGAAGRHRLVDFPAVPGIHHAAQELERPEQPTSDPRRPAHRDVRRCAGQPGLTKPRV